MTDELAERRYPVGCPECGKVSLKSIVQLEVMDKVPCDFCGVGINTAVEYGPARLEEILKGLGRPGSIHRQGKKLD